MKKNTKLALAISLALLFAVQNHAVAQSGNAPSARQSHTTVWTGNDMIVWGGQGPGTFPVNRDYDGSRYNPSANTWTATQGIGLIGGGPYFHTAVWTGSKMIVWGGGYYDNAGNFYVSGGGGLYDPALNSWSAATNTGAPTARTAHGGLDGE